MDKLIKKIKSRVLTESDYKFISTDTENMNLKLKTKVILYFDGVAWKIVPLDISLNFPIIYDVFIDEHINQIVSIVVCPYTLRSIMIKGKYTIKEYKHSKIIIEDIKKNNQLSIDSYYGIDKDLKITNNKRYDVKIMTLKDAIILVPDALFIQVTKKYKDISLGFMNYYENLLSYDNTMINKSLFHPKTLVYVLHYISEKTGLENYTIILGSDAKKKSTSGFDLSKSGFMKYLHRMHDKISESHGYIMATLYYIAKEDYPLAHIVYL